MPAREQALTPAPERCAPSIAPPRRSAGRWSITGGGTDGNEQLTAMTGVVLIGLLAVLGVTILRIGQLISVHLFVGLLLIGPVALKMGSTGYRFMRYYTGDREYVHRGPPLWALRLLAPFVILTTVVVFLTGVVLLFNGPSGREPWLLLHKASFILWLGATGLHVLGHLPGFGGMLGYGRPREEGLTASPGAAGRWITLAGALVAGLVLALVLIPDFHTWTAAGAFPQHHDH